VINTALPTGVPHVSVHGETGLTVPPQDVQALADAIQKLTSDADLRQAYGVAAKKRTETVFAEETIMQQVYDSLRDGIRLDNEQSTKQKNLRKN
jgi:rhamnosyl/mannosyltransferase